MARERLPTTGAAPHLRPCALDAAQAASRSYEAAEGS